MTPAQIIVAATCNAADLIKIADTGAVAECKSADFMVLDANTNTRRIASVYLRGSKVDCAALAAKWTSGTSR